MTSVGATLHRGKIQCLVAVKIEAYSKQGDEIKGELYMALINYFFLPRLFGDAVEPVKEQGFRYEYC
jgi:uncharacterized protein Yka (UPF0111/DUF47 family)